MFCHAGVVHLNAVSPSACVRPPPTTLQEVRAWLLSLPPDLHKYELVLQDEGFVVAAWTEKVGAAAQSPSPPRAPASSGAARALL